MPTIRALRSEETDEMIDLVHESYVEYADRNPICRDRDRIKRRLESDPHFSLELNRVLEIDGRLVARVGIYDRRMSFMGEELRVGAIGGVCTHPEFRRRGYTRQLLADSVATMEEHGFHVSHLFGEPAIYGGSGWQTLSTFGMSTNLPLDTSADVETRPADFGSDLPAIAALYSRLCAALNGPFHRDRAYWQRWIIHGKLKESDRHAVRIVAAEGRTVGYFITAGAGHVSEMAWDTDCEEALGSVLNGIARSVETDVLDFGFFHQGVFDYLSRHSLPLSLGDVRAKDHFLRKGARYAGLFRLIGNHSPVLREVEDTAALNQLLRSSNYVFWELDHF